MLSTNEPAAAHPAPKNLWEFRAKSINYEQSYSSLFGKQQQQRLLKWGLQDRIQVYEFQFKSLPKSPETPQLLNMNMEYFCNLLDIGGQAELDTFWSSIFNCPEFRQHFKVWASGNGGWAQLQGTVKAVEWQRLHAHHLSLEFFDRLQTAGIIRENGSLVQCMPEWDDDSPYPMQLNTELHRCLFQQASEHFTLFSKDDRKEWMYELLKMLLVGGQLCQWDDEFQPYTDIIRQLYRDFLSVVKNQQGRLQVVSRVFKITGLKFMDDDQQPGLFPNDHPMNVLYFVVDPFAKTIKILYHAETEYL